MAPRVCIYSTAIPRATALPAKLCEWRGESYQICKRKLESKCEALLILSRELDQCRSERDQFKLMAEQLRDRYQMVKRQLTGDTPVYPSHMEIDPKTYTDIHSQSIARILFDTKESNKALKFQVDDLKQKLHDAEGDIKLLREQIARSRVGTTDEGLNTRHFPAHEREALVKELEASREEIVQRQRDLQQVLDEKEDLETERDAYRTKHERLNTELNYILGGDDKRIVDIDALNMENKFLQERLKQMEEEKSMAIATVSKYKSILEKKKMRGMLKLGQSRSGGLVITQKQVQDILQNKSPISVSPQALADLQGLCGALLDTINDKNLALSHQRKTNKLLGNRVSELEKKLKTLEVSGLWSVSGQLPNLEKLKAECEDIKTLVPVQLSPSHSGSEKLGTGSDVDSLPSSLTSSNKASPAHGPRESSAMATMHLSQLSHLDLEELDLLPTKEEVVKVDESPPSRKSSTQWTLSPLDDSPGLSDLRSTGQRADIQDPTLNSFIRDRKNAATKAQLWGTDSDGDHLAVLGCDVLPETINHSQKEVHIDYEKREAEIMRILRNKSEESEDDSHMDILGMSDGSSGIGNQVNDCDEEDEEEAAVYDEASEHLRNLLESVTQKLLQRPRQEDCQIVGEVDTTDRPGKHNRLNSLDSPGVDGKQDNNSGTGEEEVNVVCIEGWEIKEQEPLPCATEKSRLICGENHVSISGASSIENQVDAEGDGQVLKKLMTGKEGEKC
ncbi:coiled-coil domain-containing protein 149-like [Elysia marginata]|uniref:Coiled-coil domain-containing protein 149-like n=1 Tax=Elysia marginata TaxID=1093978 RepID=A0AAV4H135_9GAST|nr:coiled-coil domain-containing protein 149-like [Elysia marginata]